MPQDIEINRGYVDIAKGTAVSNHERRYFYNKIRHSSLVSFLNIIRPLLIPLILVYGLFLVLILSIYKLFNRNGLSEYHRESLQYIPEFVSQYPMHLYPIVAKSLEYVFLKEHLGQYSPEDKIVEVAIGEGTFSARLFSPEMKVVGLDLNPYSLHKTLKYKHVTSRVVCDCLTPPVRPGTFDLLVANNFLHHVSDKRTTLHNWSKIAKKAIFNENTPYWASSWTMPYVISAIGLSKLGDRVSNKIERHHLQELDSEQHLDEFVKEYYTIDKRESFMDRKTFFLCSIFSLLMITFGPPTPKPFKKILLMNPLNHIALPLTKKIAELLIYYDSGRSRKYDTYISYYCESKNVDTKISAEPFMCPDCNGHLEDHTCASCGRAFDIKENMLFLLPLNFQGISDAFHLDIAESVPEEHL